MAAAFARRSRPTFRPPSPRPSAAELAALTPDRALVARFDADLAPLTASPLGLAVSGGADSLALLLLAAAARQDRVAAFSVDHGLRSEAAGEVAAVAALCARLDVPHHALRVTLADGPDLQARARDARYAMIGEAAERTGIAVVLTAHHADDQAETVLMRLARGAGVGGLSGIRPFQPMGGIALFRPLLGWTRAELRQVCRDAEIEWAEDPSNANVRFERARVRTALGALDLDPHALTASAAALRDADEALDWMTEHLGDRLQGDGDVYVLDPAGLPAEIVRRLALRAFASLGANPRGPDLKRALAAAREGRKSGLAGVLLEPLADGRWRLAVEPPRRR